MNDFVDFFKGFDIHQLISTASLIWLLTNFRFKKMEKNLEDLKSDVKSIDRRLNRLEGRF